MAALGQILRKGVGAKSVHQTAQYERLNQDPCDNEEEEDDILFIQEGGSNGKQNGFTHTREGVKQALLPNGDSNDSIELARLGIQPAKIKKASEVEVRTMRFRSLARTRTACFILTLLFAVGFVIGLIFVLSRNHIHRSYKQSREWNHTFSEHGTESLVQLYDVDEDGRLDIIFCVMPSGQVGQAGLTRKNEKEYCEKYGFKKSPCMAQLYGLRGYDGAIIWQTAVHSSIFEINCDNIDVNKDGKMDCIGTGRLTTIVAFDPRNGEVFWTADTLPLEDKWNNYNVLVYLT